jgi:hypothetical protein
MFRLARTVLPGAIIAGTALLSGCASSGLNAPARYAAVPTAPPPMPTLPPGLPSTMNVPATDAAGTYLTLNHNVDQAQAVWHMRSALNVAALGCRGGAREAAIIAAYNRMLKVQKAPLAKAVRATESRYKAERGKTWQSDYDAHMTRVYNFFAQPAAQQRFCEVAAEVIAEGAAVSPADFTTFAAAALPRLEAPFTDAYRAFDGYRRELAAWQAQYGTGVALADASKSGARATPQLAYAEMDGLLRWDARESRVRTASR